MRDLVAGTIIGSGTVSNHEYAVGGSACRSERRAIEIIGGGAAATAFMAFGNTISMEVRCTDGTAPSGTIHQSVVRA